MAFSIVLETITALGGDYDDLRDLDRLDPWVGVMRFDKSVACTISLREEVGIVCFW